LEDDGGEGAGREGKGRVMERRKRRRIQQWYVC
jgi:hypothetical protein